LTSTGDINLKALVHALHGMEWSGIKHKEGIYTTANFDKIIADYKAKHGRYSREIDPKIIEMRERGLSYEKIVEVTGIKKGSIHYAISKNNREVKSC
jgi:DNA-binding transcriptional regulator YhcF (GntR family)